jgi:tetratricopeptide (TPR) repeat protein/transcriptional regulator with XRE-family HTH domain
MQSFNDLLNQYVQRAGISDAELARTLGVSRQTIFRWREGMTARPRHRDDVLAIARKLRLTIEERDRLLLAAGFRPEEVTEAGEPGSEVDESEIVAATSRRSILGDRWWIFVAVAGVLLVAVIAWWVYAGQTDSALDDAPRNVSINPSTTQTASTSFSLSAGGTESYIDPAAPGETLVLVTHFANYASSQVGYNVAGRLAQALQQEIDNTRLEDIRIAIWPEAVDERSQALQVGQAVSATLVIFGEYDVGRVMVEFAHPADQSAFVDPALQQHVAGVPELSATINSDLPQEVRSLALIALGQIYLTRKQADQARPLLVQARDNFKNTPARDEKTWGLVNFYLGLAYHNSYPADMDQAIEAYDEAIKAWPTMLSSYLNRSAAYASRLQSGDLEKALADMDYIVKAKPDWPLAYSNRASVRIHLGEDENLQLAQADLERALDLDSNLPGAYVQRAYLFYKQDKPMADLEPDLEKALALRPDDTSALNLYCWGYAVEQQPEKGLAYCQQMVEIDPAPILVDSRGVTYALLGDYEAAIVDFEVVLAWMDEQPNEGWQQPIARRRAWIEALKAGENPFTPELLAEIRHEFGK